MKNLGRVRPASAALLVALLVTAGAATAAVDPLSPVSGPSPFPRSCDDDAFLNDAYRNAEVEPSVAADPTRPGHLIAAWQQDRFKDGGARAIAVAVSDDGGVTWTRPSAPAFTRCAGGTDVNGGDYRAASDPWVSIGPDGTAYLMALGVDVQTGDGIRNAIVMSRSTDGGRTWSTPATLASDFEDFNDKNTVTADPIRPGSAYAVWSRSIGLRKHTYFSRTRDGGVTWEPARRVVPESAGHQPIGHQIVVLPGGALLMAYVRQALRQRSALVVASSGDQGTTWSRPRTIATLPRFEGIVVDPFDGSQVRTGEGSVPDLAVDPRTGSVYVVWQATRAAHRTAVLLSRSDDAAASWSAPRPVNSALRTQAFTPSVEVNSDGTVAVTYFDFSANRTRTRPLTTTAWIARSYDRGATFTRRERLALPFDLRTAPLVSAGRFLGDYHGLVASGPLFHAVLSIATGVRGNRTEIVATTIR